MCLPLPSSRPFILDLFVALGCFVIQGAWVSAGESEWPQFRGPTGQGISHAANVPMHWSAQFASVARVGSLIAPAADPVSGQPELKHTPVNIRRHEPKWHGFALSHEPLAIDGCSYLARARGQGCWRYELAGERVPESWPEWADALLGSRAGTSDPDDGARFAALPRASYRQRPRRAQRQQHRQ